MSETGRNSAVDRGNRGLLPRLSRVTGAPSPARASQPLSFLGHNGSISATRRGHGTIVSISARNTAFRDSLSALGKQPISARLGCLIAFISSTRHALRQSTLSTVWSWTGGWPLSSYGVYPGRVAGLDCHMRIARRLAEILDLSFRGSHFANDLVVVFRICPNAGEHIPWHRLRPFRF